MFLFKPFSYRGLAVKGEHHDGKRRQEFCERDVDSNAGDQIT